MTWSNRDEDLKNVNSLFSATFRRRRRLLILINVPTFFFPRRGAHHRLMFEMRLSSCPGREVGNLLLSTTVFSVVSE